MDILLKIIELFGGIGLKGKAGMVDHFSAPS
jgi:hypothetical protein